MNKILKEPAAHGLELVSKVDVLTSVGSRYHVTGIFGRRPRPSPLSHTVRGVTYHSLPQREVGFPPRAALKSG